MLVKSVAYVSLFVWSSVLSGVIVIVFQVEIEVNGMISLPLVVEEPSDSMVGSEVEIRGTSVLTLPAVGVSPSVSVFVSEVDGKDVSVLMVFSVVEETIGPMAVSEEEMGGPSVLVLVLSIVVGTESSPVDGSEVKRGGTCVLGLFIVVKRPSDVVLVAELERRGASVLMPFVVAGRPSDVVTASEVGMEGITMLPLSVVVEDQSNPPRMPGVGCGTFGALLMSSLMLDSVVGATLEADVEDASVLTPSVGVERPSDPPVRAVVTSAGSDVLIGFSLMGNGGFGAVCEADMKGTAGPKLSVFVKIPCGCAKIATRVVR